MAAPLDRKDNFAEAIEAARRDKRNLPELIGAAECEMAAGRHAAAVALVGVAVEIAPEDFQALRVMSGFLDATDDRRGAISIGIRAVAADPRNAEARLHLGGLLLAEGRYNEAREHLTAHIRLPGATALGYRMLSTAFAQLSRTREAIDAAATAVKVDPDTVEYRLHLASVLGARGRFGDAIAALDKAELRFPEDGRIPRTLSGIYDTLGRFPDALAAAEQATAMMPTNAEAAEHLSYVRRRTGALEPTAGPVAAPDYLERPPRPPQRRDLAAALDTRWTVIFALMLHDVRTRYSRSKLGYFWAVFEPITHLMTLGVMFAILSEGPPPVGDSMFLFYCTGLIPYLMFSHLSTEAMTTRSGSGALLLLPNVRQTDILMAKALLNIATETIVGTIVYSGFLFAGFDAVPHHVLMVVWAVFLLWLMAIGIGLINFVIHEFFDSWETWYGAVVRLLYFGSGIYYSPIDMPNVARHILLWNPILQAVELFRSGFFRDYHPVWVDMNYILAWVIGTLFLGLVLERASRQKVERRR